MSEIIFLVQENENNEFVASAMGRAISIKANTTTTFRITTTF
jgi:hypothetical protein